MTDTSNKCPISGKRSFADQQGATKFEEANRRQYGNAVQYPYPCEDCPAWHLSATPNGNSRIAQVRFPQVPVSEGQKQRIKTADVIRLKSTGMSPQQIANHCGVTLDAITYHLNKESGHNVTRKSSSVISLDDVTRRKTQLVEQQRQLTEQLAGLTAQEERLLEKTKMKFQFAPDNLMVITKNDEQITISLQDLNRLYEAATAVREETWKSN